MLGDNIKFFRNKLGLSQQELSEKLNVSRPTISSWELNRTEPTMGNIESLANIFHCRKSELIGEDAKSYQPIDFEATIRDKEKVINLLIEEARKSDIVEIMQAYNFLHIMKYKPMIDELDRIEKSRGQ